MNKTKKFLIFLSIFLILITPALSFAWKLGDPIVPCDNSTSATTCDFTQLMNLVNNIIDFILYGMAIPIAAIMFAYAGFKLVTAGGEISSARTKAKSIFLNTVIGLVLAAGAWLIIKTILTTLGFNGAWIGF